MCKRLPLIFSPEYIIKIAIVFFLAGASRSPSGTKAPSPELETDNGCGTGVKCDHKCISYDGVSHCVCHDGYRLHMNGYSCVGKP